MGTVIQVENLSKSYLIGHQSREPYLALRDVMVETVKNAGRRILHPMKAGSGGNRLEEIWALKDVSFEVQQGDRVGIIGRNGAGKSTLLKILSRITEPTSGRVRLKGRVGSLLEVGTGFHPELTGRENIFLNGAILGMTKAEIKRKFEEIVDFAEIEKFLDTPVKRYSSGMYVRLAFAVAAQFGPGGPDRGRSSCGRRCAIPEKMFVQDEGGRREGQDNPFCKPQYDGDQFLLQQDNTIKHGKAREGCEYRGNRVVLPEPD